MGDVPAARLSRHVGRRCQRCGITKPTLYYYFGNKETLFIRVLARQLHGFGLFLDSPATGRTLNRTHRSDAHCLQDRHRQHDAGHGARQGPVSARQHGPKLSPRAVRPTDRTMQDGIERGERRQNDSEFYAWIFLGLVNTFVRSRARPATPGSPMIHSCWPRGWWTLLRRGVSSNARRGLIDVQCTYCGRATGRRRHPPSMADPARAQPGPCNRHYRRHNRQRRHSIHPQGVQRDPKQLEWVNSIYALVFASLIVTWGRIGDQVGRKRIFMAGVTVFVIGSMMAGASPTIEF